MDAPWKIELFGGLRATNGVHRVERFRTQRSALLLSYLAYYLHRPHSREALIELLWPDAELSAGRNRLKQEVASLRRQLEPPGIPTGSVVLGDRYALHLNPDTVMTDAQALQEWVRSAMVTPTQTLRLYRFGEAATLLQKEFLPGFYEDWVLGVRRQMAETELQVLQQLADCQEASGDVSAALVSGRRLLQKDGLREEAHLRLMRLLAATGQSPEALRQFQELKKILKEQVGLEPSEQAFQLARHIEEAPRTVAAVARPSPHPVLSSERASEDSVSESQKSPTAIEETTRIRLPLRFTRFVGRQEELALLAALLRAPGPGRVITLTGLGGSGKTRLALEAAELVSASFPGMVAFVSLAEVRDARNIPDAILHALPLPPSAGSSEPMERLVTVLTRVPGTALLILDNFEQLVEQGGPEVVQTLRERVPHLVCLITSRMPLMVSGERDIEISPLPLPTLLASGGVAHSESPPERLVEFDSIALFVDRAQAASQTFQLTPHNAATVAALCTRLEGLPLAIELTAAWARTLTPAQMLARYSSEPDALLVSRRKDLPPRHHTMQAAIAWSFTLLPEALQRLFARLAIFRGGWTLEALEAIFEEPGAVEYLNRLRQSSLVISEEINGENRYRMLEMLREFANDQLTPEDRAEISRRHFDYYLSFMERTALLLQSPEQRNWIARLDAEHDNVRAALAWALENSPHQALQLADTTGNYWYSRGHFAEGMRWTEASLKCSWDAPLRIRAGGLLLAGTLAHELGDFPLAAARLRESLVLFRELGEERRIANCLCRLGRLLGVQGDYPEAEALLGESLIIAQGVADNRIAAMVRLNLGIIANFQRDYVRGEQEARESLALHRQNQYPWGIASALGVMAVAVRNQGNLRGGLALHEECLAQCRALGDTQGVARSLHSLGNIYLHLAEYSTALPLFQESLRLFDEISDRWNVALLLSEVAQWMAEAMAQREPAARLFGAAEAIWSSLGAPLNQATIHNRQQFMVLLRQTLSEATLEAALDTGRAIPQDRAVALALALR